MFLQEEGKSLENKFVIFEFDITVTNITTILRKT